ncbi:hypothetical protein BJ138DRAFT_1160390 [Hygrophoropsis aurantiaca]|uniref:Uncharacterized protein n=1 Tax=Hygrophoropsis aurantiaca TaxID=72124 RepID=A0ACB8A3L9_9AGAM|nr:hypothetical protein BJ138DRAFT_1160390 [Hygrophoropsis aurantiaca]
MLFMLSHSRDIEKSEVFPWFVDALARAMQHNTIHVRHSALRLWPRYLPQRLRYLRLSQRDCFAVFNAIELDGGTTDPSSEIIECYLRILYTFTFHHDRIWTTALSRTKFFGQSCKLALRFPLYIIAILDILEDRKTQCNFRDSVDQEMRFRILSNAWLDVHPTAIQSLHGPLKLDPRIASEILDDVLPRLVAFTLRHVNTDNAAMDQFIFLLDLENALPYLEGTFPGSPVIWQIKEIRSTDWQLPEQQQQIEDANFWRARYTESRERTEQQGLPILAPGSGERDDRKGSSSN